MVVKICKIACHLEFFPSQKLLTDSKQLFKISSGIGAEGMVWEEPEWDSEFSRGTDDSLLGIEE
jgi:hypothetical protein